MYMNTEKIMALYAEHERKNLSMPMVERIATDELITFVPECGDGFIAYFDVDSNRVDALIDEQIAFFKARGQGFEWKVYATDTPHNIGERLTKKGFVADVTENFMVRDMSDYVPNLELPDGIRCEKATTQDMFRDVARIQATEFPIDVDEWVTRFWQAHQANPHQTSLYVIYDNGVAVSSARVDFTEGSLFAGLWGGTTLEEYRGRGYYQMLLNYRIDEAKKRGRQYMTIDALETSRPIVAKHGFEWLTTTTPYVFTAKKQGARSDAP